MADPQSGRVPLGPVLPSWPPPTRPLPPPSQSHSHFAPLPPPFPPFPGPPGIPGFVPGFAAQQHHFYNLNPSPRPPPLPFLGSTNSPGLPANHGPFGPPPILPPRGQSQMVSGMVPPMQGPSAATGYVVSGNGVTQAHGVSKIEVSADSKQFNRASPVAIAGRDNLGLSKQEEGFTVIEEAILHSQKENRVDAKQLLSQIRALVAQAEETVQKIGKVVMLDPSMLEPHMATCPYNSTHRVPPDALFKHFLSCPSNPKPQVDAENLISSLRYRRHKSQHCDLGNEPQHKTLDFQNLSIADGKNPSSVNFNSSVFCAEKLGEAGTQVEKESADGTLILPSETKNILKTSSVSNEVDIWGGRFFYTDSPAVVQAPLATLYPALPSGIGPQLQLANTVEEFRAKLETMDAAAAESDSLIEKIARVPVKKEVCEDGPQPLLSSRFWFLLKETEMWNDLPTRCSSLVLQAATGLGTLRRKVVLDWLLIQGPAHGIVIDSAMAGHLHSLAIICLIALQKEASILIDHQSGLVKKSSRPRASEVDLSHTPGPDLEGRCGPGSQDMVHEMDTSGCTEVKKESLSNPNHVGRSLNVTYLDCPHLFQSGHLLTSQISSLFGPLQSKAFVLKLLRHCLVSSGRVLASFFVDAFSKLTGSGPELGPSSLKNFEDVKPEGKLQTPQNEKQIGSKLSKSMDETVGGSLAPLEVEEAISAVHERAVLESFLRSMNYPNKSSKLQMIQEHEAAVMMAAAERSKRVNYRPVLESDGLIWHRSQLEDKNKNKSREELLAEERDYKRRRMSYRGKKLKRNPTEVLHDLIGGHMEEILEAGGIGCFTKHTADVPPSSIEAGVVESSRGSNLDDVMKPNHDDLPLVLTSNPMSLKARDNRGSWDDQSRSQSVSRADWSNEHTGLRTFKKDFSDAGAGPQGSNYSRMEVGYTDHKESSRNKSDGSHGRSLRPDSHRTSNNHSLHSRSGRDHGRDSRDRWEGTSVIHSANDYGSQTNDRDQSHSHRHAHRWEGSVEDDSFERHRSGERKGKLSSRY